MNIKELKVGQRVPKFGLITRIDVAQRVTSYGRFLPGATSYNEVVYIDSHRDYQYYVETFDIHGVLLYTIGGDRKPQPAYHAGKPKVRNTRILEDLMGDDDISLVSNRLLKVAARHIDENRVEKRKLHKRSWKETTRARKQWAKGNKKVLFPIVQNAQILAEVFGEGGVV